MGIRLVFKKLEQTVAGNARLEQELLVLRQKLQASRGSRGSQSALGSQGAPDSIPYTGGATAVLESGKLTNSACAYFCKSNEIVFRQSHRATTRPTACR